MKRSVFLLLMTVVILFSCKQGKSPDTAAGKEPVSRTAPAGLEKSMQLVLDSIRSFKPMKLSINEEHSDVDELIPLGYNEHGSFAYLVNENSGGSSGMHFGILPAYQDFMLEARLGMDDEPDTILTRNRELIYHALRSQGIRLNNAVRKTTADSLQKEYGIRFDIKKTYGASNPDDPSGKKTLATIEISWKQGDTEYPSYLYGQKYAPAHSIYDVYISDCLLIPGQEGISGFVVLVTEGSGFEGYTRKSIELKQIGVVKGN